MEITDNIPGQIVPDIVESLREEPETSQYPKEPADKSERFRGKLELESELCPGCSYCARACPTNTITLTSSDEGDGSNAVTWSYDVGDCLFCGQCVESCPTGALEATDELDLAARDKDDLVIEYATADDGL